MFKAILFCVLFHFSLRCTLGIQCRSGWTNHGGSCYHFSNDKKTWVDALTICGKFHSHLVEIQSDSENNFLVQTKDILNVNFWIGGSDLETEGEWKWIESDKYLDYTNWNPGEPNSDHGRDEDCMDLKLNRTGWNDESCGISQNYICEQSGEDSEIIG